MLTIIGTVPQEDFPLTRGVATLEDDHIILGSHHIPVNRGTPALLAAALQTATVMGNLPVRTCLVGDTGIGHGSRELYAFLADHLSEDDSDTLVFHYLQPDVDWHNRVLLAAQERQPRPTLIADAGFMYAAKMSGQATHYDLFTPDIGELAFLADETAPHPFYTRGFILQDTANAPEYIKRAYTHDNAAKHLLVKGSTDMVADDSGILASVDSPSSPALEAMGGTGDTLTGMASTLIQANIPLTRACLIAARANRLAGALCTPTPATQVMEIVRHIPAALEQALRETDQ